jgi:CDP-paratose 2-epimerase
VTTSLTDPVEDFEVNALGTVHLLEELRRIHFPPGVVFTSTNKVYGALPDVKLSIQGGRYEPEDPQVAQFGIGEERPLDFHSPYGCSKGAADQYVLDFARTFGLPAVVFRMSCIYGPHQQGTQDQGWVAHFLRQALHSRELVIYGDGRQVRDVLFIDDLVDAMLLAQENMEELSGRAFNIGGGPQNTLSLVELYRMIGDLMGSAPPLHFENWRAADQRYYVSRIRSFQSATGWSPQTGVKEGLQKLHQWLIEDRETSPQVALASREAS